MQMIIQTMSVYADGEMSLFLAYTQGARAGQDFNAAESIGI